MAASAAAFSERWKGRGYERGESQAFWIDLLTNVFGIETPSDGFILFEDHRMVDASNFIDGRIPSTKVLIEQKSLGKDLRKGILQSDGSMLNPFQQARRYVVSLPLSEHPRWIVTCNFSEFLVYDMERPNGEPEQILLENLGKEYYRLMFLVEAKNEHLSKEMQVSMQAGEIVGRIYEALLKAYGDDSPETLRWLNILCVRIVFCLYAEDAGVFAHDQFHNYLSRFDAEGMRTAFLQLFETLNKPIDQRSRFLRDDLKAFPYTNGGLFEEEIEIPQFTEELRQAIIQNASLDFDWSEISPTIFGAVFESTLNPQTRRSGGMHYTSIENIHKVIDPLFLNDLRRELDEILEEKVEKQRQRKLQAYQDRLASLTFLDPACGSGNFLTETYLSLRRLENEAIRERYHGQSFIGFEEVNPIKVSIQQFYGIEINDFAVTVATTALWISEAQMLAETEKIIRLDIDFLPLKAYHNIREGNALRMDWDIIETPSDIPTIYAKNVHLVVEPMPMAVSEPIAEYNEVNVVTHRIDGEVNAGKRSYQVHYDYIIGNPPFVGARMMSENQKQDVLDIFGVRYKNVGNMDYVCCWYKKAWQLIKGASTQVALVSTNSICQGEQVANLWKPMMEDGLRINFAHRTFRWDSEASQKAHVHCVIVGFGNKSNTECHLYDNDKISKVAHINAYLMEAPDVFVGSRQHPIFDVPEIGIGNKPIDGGNYLFDKEEMEDFVKQEPTSAKYFHPWYGSLEFIHQKP
ncbi:MAG: class I SAM-dependent DNA methyltransferase, partial [Bacteroidaceae bacterium]|nr:class I SAM-dependent DNA methyltransferase [Bacteroidaceae bacterium]